MCSGGQYGVLRHVKCHINGIGMCSETAVKKLILAIATILTFWF